MGITVLNKNTLIYVFSILFLLVNQILISYDFIWLSILPLVLIVFLLSLFSHDKLFFLCVFVTPLSVTLSQLDIGASISLPSEPLLFFVTLLFLFNQLYKSSFDKKAFFHPLTILIVLHIIWLFITSITSEMPIVSFKFLIARLWFIIPCYFFLLELFKKPENYSVFHWSYIFPLSIVIVFSTFRLWIAGFDDDFSQSAMTPFYPSHTSYGAIIAMLSPYIIFIGLKKTQKQWVKLCSLVLLSLFCIAIILSYSRAVRISIPIAALIYLSVLLKIRFRTILIIGFVFIGFLYSMKNEILIELQKNKQDSSEELVENFQSISNISTDDSNIERLNRWAAAISMFKERPIWGWGPGTYQFQYAPFQSSTNITLISTNAGDLGNAHSEYISPLAETGLIGGVIFWLIALYAVSLGYKIVYECENHEIKLLAISTLLGLSTYLVHGFLNNYLDIEKAAIPFWSFLAILASIDLYHKRSEGI